MQKTPETRANAYSQAVLKERPVIRRFQHKQRVIKPLLHLRICLCENFSEYASRQYLSLSFRFYPQYSTAKWFLQEEISFLIIFDIFLIYD